MGFTDQQKIWPVPLQAPSDSVKYIATTYAVDH